jgi:hypothetical protein
MQALRHRVQSLREQVAYPWLGRQRVKQDGRGRRRHQLPRDFCRWLGLGRPKTAFAKIAALSKKKQTAGIGQLSQDPILRYAQCQFRGGSRILLEI